MAAFPTRARGSATRLKFLGAALLPAQPTPATTPAFFDIPPADGTCVRMAPLCVARVGRGCDQVRGVRLLACLRACVQAASGGLPGSSIVAAAAHGPWPRRRCDSLRPPRLPRTSLPPSPPSSTTIALPLSLPRTLLPSRCVAGLPPLRRRRAPAARSWLLLARRPRPTPCWLAARLAGVVIR